MALSPDMTERLEQALFDATALVTSETTVGTAFFIDDTRLLTCAHVVGGFDEISVKYRDITLQCSVEDRDEVLDVAVLRAPQGVADPTAVLLHDDPPRPGQPIVTYGFPLNAVTGSRDAKDVRTDATTRWREASTGITTMVELGGTRIQKGMSGGPVLNLANGGVVGIVRYSYDPGREEGGGAIPIAACLSRFPTVRASFDTPARSTRRWQQVLGPAGLDELTRDITGARTDRAPESTIVDIRLTGDRTGWKVTLDGCLPVSALTDLEAADIAAAVFSWASRRGNLTDDELGVLGRMLFRVLMPAPIEAEFDNIRQRTVGPLMVQLNLSAAPTLQDVPWEYAKGAGRRALAADPELALVRVSDSPRPGRVHHRPQPRPVISRDRKGHPDRPIRAAIVVAQPRNLEKSLPPPDASITSPRRTAYSPWPSMETLHKRLVNFISPADDNNDEFEIVSQQNPNFLLNPSLNQLDDGLRLMQPAGLDVLHLVGFGRLRRDRVGELAFADEFDRSITSWQRTDDVLDVITRGVPPTILVVQLGLLPPTMEEEPLGLSAFLPALGEGILAIVGAGGALHADLYDPFNKFLYAELRAGRTIEAAVQLARERLTRPTLGDPGLYGTFMACTTSRAKDIRLVQPRPLERPRLLGERTGP